MKATTTIDLLGKRFGRLVVIAKTKKRQFASIIWLCQCDCGAKNKVNGSSLRRGITTSCGCYRKEWGKRNAKKDAARNIVWRAYKASAKGLCHRRLPKKGED